MLTFPAITYGGASLTGPSSDGTSGQTLVTDGSGNLSFADAGGGGAESLTDLDEWDSGNSELAVPGALIVRQAGGTAGVDQVAIYHDGSNAHIVPGSGECAFGGGKVLIGNRIYIDSPVPNGSLALGNAAIMTIGANCPIIWKANNNATGASIGRISWSSADEALSIVGPLLVSSSHVLMPVLPTSDPEVAGAIWSNGGVLTVSSG